LVIHKNDEKPMPKGTSQIIADAERHRRTPWTLAVESKAIEGMKSADIGGTGEEKDQERMPEPSTNHRNGTPNPFKIDEKSRLRGGCDFKAFWGWAWGAK
jgi:hypothetical protein